MKKEIGEIIKRYRAERQMSQGEFAQELARIVPGSSTVKQHVSRWENGDASPNYFYLVIILLKDKGWAYNMALEILQVLKPEEWRIE